jgi:nucleoside-diphosphate-sugar epimerase
MIMLVTGGCGFIGLNLIDHLARNEVKVIVTDRPETECELDRLDVDAQFRPLDVIDRAACIALLREVRPSHVMHGAALTLTDRSQAARTLAVNQTGTANLLEAAIAAGSVERALILSSSGVYAPGAPDPCPETGPVSAEGAYARSKLAAEGIMADIERRGGFPVAAARIGAVYGPHERPRATRPRVTLIQTLLDHLHADRPLSLGGGDYSRDWVHAEDIAAALLALLTTPRLDHRVYNVSSGISVSARRIIRHFVERGLRMNPAEQVETADLVLDPGENRPSLDITRLRQDTGFAPRFDMMRGLDHLIAASKDSVP